MNDFKKNIYKQNNNFCILPTLNSVVYTMINLVSFDFDVNGFNYGIFTPSLQYTIDNEVTWIVCNNITQISVDLWTGDIVGVNNNIPIKYRIILSGNECNNQISNIIDGGNWQGR